MYRSKFGPILLICRSVNGKRERERPRKNCRVGFASHASHVVFTIPFEKEQCMVNISLLTQKTHLPSAPISANSKFEH